MSSELQADAADLEVNFRNACSMSPEELVDSKLYRRCGSLHLCGIGICSLSLSCAKVMHNSQGRLTPRLNTASTTAGSMQRKDAMLDASTLDGGNIVVTGAHMHQSKQGRV